MVALPGSTCSAGAQFGVGLAQQPFGQGDGTAETPVTTIQRRADQSQDRHHRRRGGARRAQLAGQVGNPQCQRNRHGRQQNRPADRARSHRTPPTRGIQRHRQSRRQQGQRGRQRCPPGQHQKPIQGDQPGHHPQLTDQLVGRRHRPGQIQRQHLASPPQHLANDGQQPRRLDRGRHRGKQDQRRAGGGQHGGQHGPAFAPAQRTEPAAGGQRRQQPERQRIRGQGQPGQERQGQAIPHPSRMSQQPGRAQPARADQDQGDRGGGGGGDRQEHVQAEQRDQGAGRGRRDLVARLDVAAATRRRPFTGGGQHLGGQPGQQHRGHRGQRGARQIGPGGHIPQRQAGEQTDGQGSQRQRRRRTRTPSGPAPGCSPRP